MSRRATSILGAGAVLGFDFEGIIPTTDNITQEVVKQQIKGLDVEEADI